MQRAEAMNEGATRGVRPSAATGGYRQINFADAPPDKMAR
jgi:hypothetical protein